VASAFRCTLSGGMTLLGARLRGEWGRGRGLKPESVGNSGINPPHLLGSAQSVAHAAFVVAIKQCNILGDLVCLKCL